MNIKDNTTIYGSVYGGGNQGNVLGLIESIIESSKITGNVYGGGNQAPVGQSGNTNIALSLTLSNAQANNVFGGGNAAPTVMAISATLNTGHTRKSRKSTTRPL